MKEFIVLDANEDGEYSLSYMTAKEIKKEHLNGDFPRHVFEEFPDLGYCGDGILIIDGTIIIPKPKKIVKDWEI